MDLLTFNRAMDSRAAATGSKASNEQRVRWTASELQRAYLDDVYRFVARQVSRREDAEDITAEVFAAAFRALPSFRRLSGERTWLLGIAQRKVADHLRRTGRRQDQLWCETPGVVNAASSEPGPDTLTQRAEAEAEVRKIVAALPSDQRDALVLQYADGLSIAEIAELMGKSAAAVNSLLQRARARIYQEGRAYFAEPA